MQNLGTNLQPYHTFGIKAQAQQILQIETKEELCQVWQQYQQQQVPILLLGEGSNVLFIEDFAGVVLLNRIKGIEYHQDENYHYLSVNAGENWHQFVEYCVERNIGGLENLALIPGCVGSSPVQNIGAYGVELKDVCESVDVVELATGKQFSLSNQQCQFAYRESVFKHQYSQGYAVIAVHFKLAKNWQPVLSYGNLADLDTKSVTPKQVFEQVCLTRKSKLPDPKLIGSAGSFFKNPVVSSEQFNQLYQRYPTMPHYPQADGSVKLAAGWLIDQCGLKGYQLGGAAVHDKQALVLINKDNATGREVAALAKYICQQVAERFSIQLSPEVRFIGKSGEVAFDEVK
ncbi:UDP-N-acetylmuramate dehydrogenase [Gallibacterium salpingitidis]|uniref:UDP-N-acetylenolpyruvoylglucosamine reductase n=1 Tax=Gallibacterium salpingitidis TaxID=505341 RepID=A0A1A7NYQ7_9PAST|nr:UDP-N-acetylmuramate dehydrogenase [Gallibacterium salpingitidis]OBW94129.1 UDP-N-acetylenolpyruvoylglucosamine reductase [Gallibacterium salpingitidis]